MAHVSHKLSNAFQGALAGGGDPATSPLYVFGPFLRLIVVAGVAQITFGASVWLVIFTVVMVSAMYRLVMQWVIGRQRRQRAERGGVWELGGQGQRRHHLCRVYAHLFGQHRRAGHLCRRSLTRAE